MMIQSHAAGVVLAGLVLARFLPWRGREWLLALGFGVVMDLDHLLNIPRYVLTHGAAGLDVATMLQWGHLWQGFMHTPWALALVVPAVLYFRSPVPALFWGLHLFQDFVVASHWVVWGSPLEWLVFAGLVAACVGLVWAQHRFLGYVPGWPDRLGARVPALRGVVSERVTIVPAVELAERAPAPRPRS